MRQIVLCHPVRTAIGRYGGSLKGVVATELGAVAIRETLRRASLDVSKLGSVTMGNVVQAGNRMNPARQAAVNGSVPVSIPALTVNRVCGSGAQAIATAADETQLGHHDVAIAGGMENLDHAPYLTEGGRWGHRMGHAQILDSMLDDGLVDTFSGEHSGRHTEDVATKSGIDREAQDAWAARSQTRFAKAQATGAFDAQITPVEIKSRKGVEAFARDEAPRAGTSIETLAKLKPAFRKDGTITAGNAPGLNSGAAAMIVAERNVAETNGLAFGRLDAYGVGAGEPDLFGLGPLPAVRQVLEWAGWSLGDLERVEINGHSRSCLSPSPPRRSVCPSTSSTSRAEPLPVVI